MTYEELEKRGEERTNALLHLTECLQKQTLPEVLTAARKRASDAVIAYERLTQPVNLLPYVLRLLHDASRWRHIRHNERDLLTRHPLTPEEADAFIDQRIEERADETSQQGALL